MEGLSFPWPTFPLFTLLPLPSSFSFLLSQQSFWWRGIRRFKDDVNFAISSATHVLEMFSTILSCYSCMVSNPIRGPLHPPSSSDGNRGRSPAQTVSPFLSRVGHRRCAVRCTSNNRTMPPLQQRRPTIGILFPLLWASPLPPRPTVAARHALDS